LTPTIERAGIQVQRSYPLTWWYAPDHVALDGGDLVFDPRTIHKVSFEPELLSGFLALAYQAGDVSDEGFLALDYRTDVSDQAILRFAKKWGSLGLCAHGVASPHGDWTVITDADIGPGGVPDECWPTYRESAAIWRALASMFAATLEIAAALHNNERVSRSTVQAFHGWLPNKRQTPAMNKPGLQYRRLLTDRLNYWLSRWAGVHPIFQWEDTDSPTIEFGHSWRTGCAPALVLQLTRTVALKPAIATCSACGIAYTPQRHPKKNQRNYCARCRAEGIPVRDAVRSLRARKRKQTRRTLSHGKARTK
jgi:hypothetical protein